MTRLLAILATLALWGCSTPCGKLADKVCDELGEGPPCLQARLRAQQKKPDQALCKRDLDRWPVTLKRLKSGQAAYNQLTRIAPGATKPKVLPPSDGGPPLGGGHHPGDGPDHGHGDAPRPPKGLPQPQPQPPPQVQQPQQPPQPQQQTPPAAEQKKQ